MTILAHPSTGGAAASGATGAEVVAVLEPLVRQAAGRGRRTLVSATLATDRCDPIELYAEARAAAQDLALWLQPSDGFGLVAVGVAWAVLAAGPRRFLTTAEAWSDLLHGAVDASGGPARRGTGPLLIGGFPFAASAERHDPAWKGFERSSLVLPKLLLTTYPDGAWLTVNVVVGGDTEDSDEAAMEDVHAAAELWELLRAGLPSTALRSASGGLRSVAESPRESWRTAIARYAGAVGRGRVDKVVVARRLDLEGDGDIDIPATLGRLEVAAPESTIFAISHRGRTFLGASPERLALVEGREYRTVALAGSAGRGEDAAKDDRLADSLVRSDKDREEHRVVVEMLRESLAPISERLVVERRPHVVRLRHVQHLASEISGRLRDRVGILALIERLHPTPAVGGQPRDIALDLIQEEERLDRGWYAGPIGWVDPHGDGEFAVALRAGVVRGRAVSLFAGCGIVADSDPDLEWEESRLKLRLLEWALGQVEP